MSAYVRDTSNLPLVQISSLGVTPILSGLWPSMARFESARNISIELSVVCASIQPLIVACEESERRTETPRG
jgi:hypothetical protein